MLRLNNCFPIMIIIFIHLVESNNVGCPKHCSCFSTVVNCSNQHFKFIPPLPDYTEILYINDNPLEIFSKQSFLMISSPTNLTWIDLTRTKLRHIDPDVLRTIFNDVYFIQQSLLKLTFDENELVKFPFINNASNLRTLSLSSNQLNSKSIMGIDIFATYPHLESLDLSYNAIKMIPKHFLTTSLTSSQYINNLTQLILNNNKIETIGENAFELLTNLKILKLSKNNIAILSKLWLGQLNNLREFDLNYNQINKIDTLAFEGLKSLKILKMRRNKLGNLSDGAFWGLSKLQKLYLDHNEISEIREGWIYGLKSLKELTLKHNSIMNIAVNSWNSLHSLIEINLSYNKLEHIKNITFEKLSNLQTLSLSNNYISYLDEHSFRWLKNLETLDLSNNKLSWAIENSNGSFVGLVLLKELRLDNNQIQLIYKHTFNGLKSLMMLNLTSNPISSIQNGSFEWFENLNELYLENVDLLCDCTMKWFLQWLQISKIRKNFAKKIQCKHPRELLARTFLDIDPNEFKCQDFLKPYLLEDFDITKPIAAIKNEEIIFTCKVTTSHNGEIIFKWFKDNQIVDHKRAKFDVVTEYSANVINYTSVLKLIGIRNEDQGKYHCMASNNYGSVYSRKFSVNVYIIPYFTKEPQNITVKIGHTAKLECAAKGQPTPIISWQKDGGDNFPAAMERRMHMMPDDVVFFIVDVKKSDMGSYSCHAANEAGSIVSTVFLNVIKMPSFVRKMIDKKASLGSTVSLECMAAGIPMPQIIWYKDEQLLQPTERHFFTAEGQLLIIVKLKSSDQGVYSCNISNAYGMAYDSSYLEIVTHHNLDKNEDLLHSFLVFTRTHAYMALVIIICIFFTSLAWIIVIFYLGQKHKRHIERYRNPKNFSESNFDSNQTDQQITENNYDFSSETSSELDTGIEEGGQSFEEEHELVDINNCLREYYSLPRKSFYNNQTYSDRRSHYSLPQICTKSHPFDIAQQQKQLFISNNYPRLSALSPKEKKLLVKKQIHQQMMSIRKFNNNNNNNFNDNFERSFQMYSPQITRTFSTNEMRYSPSY